MSISRSAITSRIGMWSTSTSYMLSLDLVGVDALAHRQVALRVEVDGEHAWPDSAKATARLRVVVVFATPPFWLAKEMTLAPCAPTRRRCAAPGILRAAGLARRRERLVGADPLLVASGSGSAPGCGLGARARARRHSA